MRIQARLTLGFAAVALLPIAALTGVARAVVANQYEGELRRALERTREEVEREHQRVADEVVRAAERSARADDPVLGALLVELAQGPLDAERRRALALRAEAQMRALELDALELLDEGGEILAAPHLPGRVGDQDPLGRELARAGGAADLRALQLSEGGRPVRRWLVVAGREASARLGDGAPTRVALVVGRAVERALRLPSGARLLGADGLALSGPGGPPAPGWLAESARVELKRRDGSPGLAVELSVPEGELRRTLDLIGVAALGLGGSGLLLALLVGWVVARRFAGRLGELAEGARAVAQARLDVQVPVRGRDEVGELAQAFNGMTRDLREAREALVRAERVAAWREIAQRIAHEIKNPLTPILMAVETLERAWRRRAEGRGLDEAALGTLVEESARSIHDEVSRLKTIVGEFSSFARMPAPRLAEADLNGIVEGALRIYRAGDAPVSLTLAPQLPPAWVDRDQLTQVLVNLVENAREAAGPAGRVKVVTGLEADVVSIAVSDDGPGIVPEVRERLFTPYFTTKAKGTGLGLAIVQRIVDEHGGRIRVDSIPGAGATFTVVLPVRSEGRTGAAAGAPLPDA